MELLRGCIEGLNDPKKLGRVQARVLGYHTENKEILPSESLPWCQTLGTLDGGGIYGSKPTPILGSWVYLLDLGNGIEFLILGGIQTNYKEKPDFNQGFSDPSGIFPNTDDLNHGRNPIAEGEHQTPNNNIKFSNSEATDRETDLSTVEYPYNNVYYDQQQNILEIDASPGAPRIRIQHSSGSKIEMDKDGNIVVTGSTNLSMQAEGLIAMTAKGNMNIDGDLKVTGSIQATDKISSNSDVTAEGEVADNQGNLSSLRDQHDKNVNFYNTHMHPTAAPGPPSLPTVIEVTDPVTRTTDFTWSGSEL